MSTGLFLASEVRQALPARPYNSGLSRAARPGALHAESCTLTTVPGKAVVGGLRVRSRPRRHVTQRRTRALSCQATNSSLPCCPPDSEPLLPARSDYTLRGAVHTLTSQDGSRSVDVYVSLPPAERDAKAAVLVVHDIAGPFTGRHVEVCDQLAAEGYVVAMPDLFQGTVPVELPAWWKLPALVPMAVRNIRRRWRGELEEDVATVVAHLTTAHHASKVGLLGFCYGAWVVFKGSSSAASARLPAVSCGVSMHPSVHQVAPFQGEDATKLAEDVARPQLVLATSGEPASWRPGGEVDRVLRPLGGRFELFPDRRHGFFTRGDASDPAVSRDMRRAFDLTVEFFAAHLKGAQ